MSEPLFPDTVTTERKESLVPMRAFVVFQCDGVRATQWSEEEWERNFKLSLEKTIKHLRPHGLHVTALTMHRGPKA